MEAEYFIEELMMLLVCGRSQVDFLRNYLGFDVSSLKIIWGNIVSSLKVIWFCISSLKITQDNLG